MRRHGTEIKTYARIFRNLAFLFLAVFCVCSWATCRKFSDWGQCSNYYNACTHTIEQGGYTVFCQFGSSCTSENTLCSTLRPCKSGCEGATWQYGNEYYAGGYNTNSGDDYCTNANSGCSGVALYDRLTCGARVVCTEKCEADSVACIGNGKWVHTADTCYCNSCQGAECCDPGEIYNPRDDECIDCKTRKCCDSLNTVIPVTYDTTWNGCVGTDGSPSCQEKHAYTLDGKVARTWYECNGKSSYHICQTQYIFDNVSCKPSRTRSCFDITKTEDRCSDVQCDEVWDKQLGDLVHNDVTQCWEGSFRLVVNMVCENGEATFPSYGEWHSYTVCDSWLDSNHTDIYTYINGDAPGGNSLDAQGNLVTNSSGGGQGGSFNTTTTTLTTTDSSGNITTVKDSQGNDSMVTTTEFTQIECMGVYNGIAVLHVNMVTVTCSNVSSCEDAKNKYYRGECWGGNIDNTDMSNNDNIFALDTNSFRDSTGAVDGNEALNSIAKNMLWMYNYFAYPSTYKSFAQAIDAIIASVTAGAQSQNFNRDSLFEAGKEELWKRVFGNNLDGVSNIAESVTSASSVASQAITSATSAVENALSHTAYQLGLDIEGASGTIRSAINDASTANTTGMAQGVSVITSFTSSKIDMVLDSTHKLIDSIHTNNSIGRSIFSTLDTGGIIPRNIHALGDSLHVINTSLDGYRGAFDRFNSMFDSLNTAQRDTMAHTNTLLKQIADNLPSQDTSSGDIVVDTSYADTLDYSVDSSLLSYDSVVSEYVQSVNDSISSMVTNARTSFDSVMRHIDSVRADTNNNLLAMDSLYKWHKDTAQIKQKFSNLFLPSQISNQCFVCTYHEVWWHRFEIDLRFDAGNIYNLDLCEFIRNIIKISVSIIILFGTIGAFIRAFGGGGGGAP